MAASPVTRNATVIAKNFGTFVYDEGTIDAGIASVLPGTVVKLGANGVITLVDGSAATPIPSWWLLTEQEALGKGMDEAYLAGDYARLWKPRGGDQFRAVVAQNADAIAGYAAGDLFKLGANGVFAPYAAATVTGALSDLTGALDDATITAALANGAVADNAVTNLAVTATIAKDDVTLTSGAVAVAAFCPNPLIVQLVTALPLDNLKSATVADRVVIFEVI